MLSIFTEGRSVVSRAQFVGEGYITGAVAVERGGC